MALKNRIMTNAAGAGWDLSNADSFDYSAFLREQGLQAPEKERIAIGKKIYMLHVDQVWSIGVAGFGLSIYGIYIANNRLGNVPRRMFNAEATKTPAIGLPMTFFYK